MQTELWGLRLTFGGNSVDVFGTEEIMSTQYNEVKQSMQSGDVTPVMEVSGLFNTYDRAERKLTFRIGELTHIELYRNQ